MALDDLAAVGEVSSARLAALEAGSDWADSRRLIAVLAAALRLDPADLTGQPYPPSGDEHARLLEAAFHLRRYLAGEEPCLQVDTGLSEVSSRISGLVRAERAGDEGALAAAAPEVLSIADGLAHAAQAGEREQASLFRATAHVVAAGLVRRLGYKDLCWSVLHCLRADEAELLLVRAEEVRLLLDLGLAEQAAARAAEEQAVDADADLLMLGALAHAVAGSRILAEQALGRAAARASDPRDHTRVLAARAVVSVEVGAFDEAADHIRRVDVTLLEPADAVQLLVTAATAAARQGDCDAAASLLIEAETTAPLRFRLDPFVHDLLRVLTGHIGESSVATAIRQLAERVGTG